MHITKVKLSGGNYKKLVNHMERKHKYYKSDVDITKSKDNVILKPYISDLKGFISDQGVQRVRKDSVGALNIVCHVAEADKEYLNNNPKEMERWGWSVINSVLKSLNLTQGDLLGAVIHVDEDKGQNVKNGNAHLQLSVAPLIRDNEKVILSAKRVANRKVFETIHDDLQAEMTKQGFRGEYVNADKDARGLGKKSLEDYKKSQELNKELLEEKAKLLKDIKSLKQSRADLQDNNRKLSAINKILKNENDVLNKTYLEYRDLAIAQQNYLIKKQLHDDFQRWNSKDRDDISFFDNL